VSYGGRGPINSKILEALTSAEAQPNEADAADRAALDAEERREAEYAEVGLPAPARDVRRSSVADRIRALFGR